MKTLHLSIILVFLVLSSSYEFNVNGQTENSTSINSDCQSRIMQKEHVLSSAVNQPKAILFAVNSNQFKSAVNGNDVNFDYVYYGWNVDKTNCSAALQSVNMLFYVKLSNSVTSVVVKEDPMLDKVIDVIQSPVSCEGTCYGPNGCDCFMGIPLQQELQTLHEQAPLKQFKSGIPIDQIQCKENLERIQKHDDTPACVKSSSMWFLTERDWMKLVTFETISGFPRHEIKNGQIISMKLVKDESCFPYIIVTIDSKDSGNLEISVSRTILDPKINGQDDSFLVLSDGIEVAYDERDSSIEYRILNIPFEKGAKSIEIIATCLI